MPWAADLLEWWYLSSTFDAVSGQPLGPPEWPRPGGYGKQHAVLVEAVKLIRLEWPWLQRTAEKGKPDGRPRA